MTQVSINHLEREVEAARARLARNLGVLRAPQTAADFTRTLKEEAKSGLDARVASIIEDVKGRAAANPAAALAIGAGLAWRLVRHPPIATALIGAGLYSLFRSTPVQPSNGAGYLSQAKTRLQEQASQAVDFAAEQAAHATNRASDSAAELASAAKERIREKAAQAMSSGKQAASDLQERTAAISNQASEVVSELSERARAATHTYVQSAQQATASISNEASEVVSELSERARAATHTYVQSAQQAINDTEARDKILLGGAGIAVAAALTIALQRRLREGD